MSSFKIPELLSPAGSLDKLKIACQYGADAVYLAGQQFGLRTAADNFTETELVEGISFAHQRGVKVFVVLNGFLHDEDLKELQPFLTLLESLNVDAVIASDLGVIETVKAHSSLAIHLSTQASCLSVSSARFWKKVGVSRIVVGRELSIQETASIKKEVGVEVEMFIHGAMCMAYSGNCVISNYTQGRDSNRGGCAHSCRFEYSLKKGEEKLYAHFMSSKDLWGIRKLADFIEYGIDSLKVEGRMKGPHYAGAVTKVYREALDFYKIHGHFLSQDLFHWEEELKKISHRDYTEASLETPADGSSIYNKREMTESSAQMSAQVVKIDRESVLLSVKAPFKQGQTLEFVPFVGPNIRLKAQEILTLQGKHLDEAHPGELVILNLGGEQEKLASGNLVRSLVEGPCI